MVLFTFTTYFEQNNVGFGNFHNFIFKYYFVKSAVLAQGQNNQIANTFGSNCSKRGAYDEP